MAVAVAVALALALLATLPAAADGLEGRTAFLRVETWDDPSAPLLRSRDYADVVGKGPEFEVAFEGSPDSAVAPYAVVPVAVDIGPGRIDLDYAGAAPGVFAAAAFNGYLLTFPIACTILGKALVDRAATTIPLAQADVEATAGSLRIHVGGLAHDRASRIGVTFTLGDCAVS